MKKFFLTMILGSLCMTGAFTNPPTGSGTTAVVYFSCTGNTERLAKTTAKVLEADLFQIVPEKAYTDDDLDWNDRKSRSSIECNDAKSRPAIKAVKAMQRDGVFDSGKYDTVIIAYPIWWAYAPKIIYTFVENTDLNGKKIVPICTSGGSGLGNSGKDLEKHAPKANWKKGSQFRSSASEAELKKFFDGVLK